MTRLEWIELLSRNVNPESENLRYRKQARYAPDFGMATLTLEEEGRAVTVSGRLLNISAKGFMAKIHRRVDPYTALWAELVVGDETATVIGYVKHATSTVGGYKLGVALKFPD